MLKSNNLKTHILYCFLIFSILILVALWLFQFSFFRVFYKDQKINDMKYISNIMKIKSKDKNFLEIVNNLALDKSVCIEMIDSNYDLLYSSTYFGKGCISGIQNTYSYKSDFINNNKDSEKYSINNTKYDTETIIYATKLSNNRYAFINSAVEPVDTTITLIRKQLIVITFLVLIFSLIISNIISNYIAKPIKEINNEAKKLALGNFDVEFQNNNKILEIEELSKTLNFARDELSKTDELRKDLMANVSHDLKTPLTMIKLNAEIATDLHKNNLDKQIEDMNKIIQETDRLTILVNDILELSKMESNKDELNIEEFDLIKLVNNIISKYSVLQEVENYNFLFIHDSDKLMVMADKKRLEQVIYNLINNAINYTGKDNKVIIEINEDKDITVNIKDTGRGIKEEDIKYIWNKYYKNKKKHKRNLVGTGLGLSIVKEILEAHKFKYGVDSKLDVGTTFYFKIPKTVD